MTVQSLFVTQFLRDSFAQDDGWAKFNKDLETACLQIAEDDEAGQKWCEENRYDGYTSYASLNDLPARASIFDDLKQKLDSKANEFATASHMDIGKAKWEMDSFWINILNPLAAHSGHIHPHSVISGTYYVKTPEGAGALKLEDPRLPMMMNAPSLTKSAPKSAQRFIYEKPEAGSVMMWESWLRHEVTVNMGEDFRISISFNYSLV